MKQLIIKEILDPELERMITKEDINNQLFDLSQQKVKHCVGCWSCWWKTPGKCAFDDLEDFYGGYINASKAIYLVKITKGFISGNLKNLFDRMIPLYLPYTTYKTGESMHVKRYERYPTVEVYYQGTFRDEENKRIFHAYIERVFYQFYSKVEKIGHIDEYLCQGRQF